MDIVVSLNVQDYLYRFYQKCAQELQKRPEEIMEQVLFMYAGTVAKDMIQNKKDPEEQK